MVSFQSIAFKLHNTVAFVVGNFGAKNLFDISFGYEDIDEKAFFCSSFIVFFVNNSVIFQPIFFKLDTKEIIIF